MSLALTVAETLERVRDERHAELDAQLGAIQANFEDDRIGEQDLLAAFAPFDNSDVRLGDGLQGWLAASPESYAANQALAQWLSARARAHRGTTTSDLVSDRGRRGLHHFLQRAGAQAQAATSLTRRPLAAWLLLGRLSGFRGNDLSLEDLQAGRLPEWYVQGLRVHPDSFALRRRMLLHLRTEWGGSEELMLAYVRGEEPRMHGADHQRLWAQYHAQVSHHAAHFTQNTARALESARMAAELDPQYLPDLALCSSDAKRPLTEQVKLAEHMLDHLDRHMPTELGGKAHALFFQILPLEPMLAPRIGRVLQASAAAGDLDSADAWGRLCRRFGSLPLGNPIAALEQAREQGHVEAAGTLARLRWNSNAALRDRDVLAGADLGSPELCWTVWEYFDHYQQTFNLDERAKYLYLLQAADAGDNDARVALAGLLRTGQAEVGRDGVLRPLNAQPIQDSLDYAKHLLERAAHERHAGARSVLNAASPHDWDAKRATPAVRSPRLTKPPAGTGGLRRYWWVLLLCFGLLRLLGVGQHHSSPVPTSSQQIEQNARP